MISVLVVDDSVVIRRLITDALADDPEIQVLGTAPNGRIALTKIELLKPDIITLDVEMPVLDGLATLRELRKTNRALPVIMFSTLTAAGASATLDALAAGASDYVTKPANVGSIMESIRSVREQLIPRIHALTERRIARPAHPPLRPAGPARSGPDRTGPDRTGPDRTGPYRAGQDRSGTPAGSPSTGPLTGPPAGPSTASPHAGTSATSGASGASAAGVHPDRGVVPPTRVAPPPPGTPIQLRTRGPRTGRIEVIAIGCSTGGPDALSQVIRAFPANLPVPVVIVQHMPPVFTKMFAERLDRTSSVHVEEAVSDTPLKSGTVYIAPGDFHLEVARTGIGVVTRLSTGPPENFCRPAVDVLFRSVAKAFGGHVLAAVMTGMGQDGRRGSEVLAEAGAEIVVQDEATSVVWGMPGAVAHAGLADAVLPLPEIANHLISRTAGGRGARAMEVTR